MNRFPRKVPFALIMIILVAGLAGPPVLAAGPAPVNAATPADHKIEITADRLVANTKTGVAEFSGHVRATQGSTVITSDRLEVQYDQDGKTGTQGQTGSAINAITATGNVVIHFDDKVATTDKAVYHSATGVFTLTGKTTRVTSGDNAITGEMITVDRKNDRMTVESGNETRVNAVIFTDQGGLALPTPAKTAGGTPEQSP